MRGFDRNVTGIGVLADPVRRRLYEFVCSQDQPVSRDHAAHAVGIARHKAKFHLDRLEAAGLLEADYVRLTGRNGPGAGRPAKRYRRGRKEFAVTLPARDYELAGHIMADAICDSTRTGAPIAEAISKAASVRGAALAATAADHPPDADAALELAVRMLSERGYEPRRIDHAIVMANCPFHALAAEHTELVCRMNHSMLAAFVDAIAPGLLEASLEPAQNRCCVTLTTHSGDKQMTETTS
ncbi:MAG TPA: helix-turn-helix domain-containing protein [Propionibacteriaceae bacterium]|nr:helix-turn-helix domain-containing protein [Propionibacteriaceae bacterium]